MTSFRLMIVLGVLALAAMGSARSQTSDVQVRVELLQGKAQKPMSQGNVVDAGTSVLPAAFAGQMPVAAALTKMQETWNNLPADQK